MYNFSKTRNSRNFFPAKYTTYTVITQSHTPTLLFFLIFSPSSLPSSPFPPLSILSPLVSTVVVIIQPLEDTSSRTGTTQDGSLMVKEIAQSMIFNWRTKIMSISASGKSVMRCGFTILIKVSPSCQIS